jgi:hypothetical protein
VVAAKLSTLLRGGGFIAAHVEKEYGVKSRRKKTMNKFNLKGVDDE